MADGALLNEPAVDPDALEELLGRARPNFKPAKGICLNCGGSKTGRRSLARFCSDPCRSEWHNRDKKRGDMIIGQAILWRRYRRKGDFTLLCRMLDGFIAEDKTLGRADYTPAPLSAHVKVVGRRIQGGR